MRLIHFLILFMLTSAGELLAQKEKATYKIVADKFELDYNKGDFRSIFDRFDSNMKSALPLDKTKGFMQGLKSQAGLIKQREFKSYQQTAALYKTTFERGTFILSISINDESKINGLYVRPFVEQKLPRIERNKTKLLLPFNEAWTVFWGGDTEEQNYHVNHKAQKNAFDFIITDDEGKSYKTDGKSNDDYYAFGKDLIAPCDAQVVLVVDGIKDNKPGMMNPLYVPGNTVILKTSNNEYLLFAHFKQNTIAVKQGDQVKQGQLLGLCGNSGNSSEPHLHFHLQNVEDMNVATGAKCYFDKIVVNGESKSDYSPVKGEIIKSK